MKIRTVKPEFFRHKELFELEKNTGLPFRVAWAGLFGVSDREGRFRWNPETIKLDVLPFDDLDFSWILDALAASGFITKYRKKSTQDQSTVTHMHDRASRAFGLMPTFLEHQRPNSHEAKSILPPLDETCETVAVEFPTIPKRTCMHEHFSEEVEVEVEVEGKGNGSGIYRAQKVLKSKKAASPNAGAFIAAYCRAWKLRYESRPEITGKERGIAKRIIEAMSVERACLLVESYLRMETGWFLTKSHDLATFEQNLNAVSSFHDTGKQITGSQAKQADRASSIADQMRRVKEGKL